MSQEAEAVTEVAEVVTETEVDVMFSQGIEGPTDAELRGEETTETETEESKETKTKESTETETEETTKTKTNEETETEEEKLKTETTKKDEPKVTEEKTANSEPKTIETPKGFVPLAAVHEARGEIRYLKEQLQTVQDQVRTLQVEPTKETKVPNDFEVLTDEQFEDLADDNPAQAAIYLRKLGVYEADQRVQADKAKDLVAFEESYDAIIDNSVAEIEKVAPGIYDEDSGVQKELMEFAESFGFSEDLFYLTNPATKIILPGETEPLLLGEQSASILGMLVNAKTKMAPQDNSELETKLRAEITTELMKKFKTPVTETFRGLNEVSKSDNDIPEEGLAGKVLTTAQLQKLSPAEEEAYLAGS